MKYVSCLPPCCKLLVAKKFLWPRACQEAKAKNNNNKNQEQKTDGATTETKGIKSGKVQKPGTIPKFNLSQKIPFVRYINKMLSHIPFLKNVPMTPDLISSQVADAPAPLMTDG